MVTAPGSGAEVIPFLKTWVNLPMAIGFTVLYAKVRRRTCAAVHAWRSVACAHHRQLRFIVSNIQKTLNKVQPVAVFPLVATSAVLTTKR